MDAFKQTEIERMRHGGNEGWKSFFDKHETTKMTGMSWDDATIAERYSGEVGEEWKERLSAKVEGKEYVPGERKSAPAKTNTGSISRSATPLSGTANNSSSSRPQSPGTSGGKVKVDDKYFEGLGAANASRPDHLPPSQGGKYAGFGSSPAPANQEEGLPKLDELQKDPLAALGKGFGWFTSTVTKTATSVNKDFIQPTAKQVRLMLTSWSLLLTHSHRLESQTLRPRQRSLVDGLVSPSSKVRGAPLRISTDLSREDQKQAMVPRVPHRWMRARSHSGTISPRWLTSASHRAAQLGHLQWARAAILQRGRPRRRRTSGMIGDGAQGRDEWTKVPEVLFARVSHVSFQFLYNLGVCFSSSS